MEANLSEYDFELELRFKKQKGPSEAFSQLAKMYEQLITIDKHVLYNIVPTAKIEYHLTDIEFGSIKSKVIQIIKNVPDDVLKDILKPSAWIGDILVLIKQRILKAVERNEVQSKSDLEKITKEINQQVLKATSDKVIILEVNQYFVLNTINDIGIEGRKLNNSESFVYKSKKGNAEIKNHAQLNMAKLLFELGNQTIEQQRTEILKVKTLDLLSDIANWKLIRLNKQIEVKILDQEWLNEYHDRKIVIQPNDYLKLDLKITYISNPTSPKPLVIYEALKVFEVIPPEKIEPDNRNKLF